MAKEAHVLVIEDDSHALDIIATRLKAAGYAVITAGDAWEGVVRAKGVPLGLVITDIMMPGGGSGIDGYKRLRSMSKRLPVIFVTGMSLQAVRSLIPDDPKARVLGKPIKFQEIHQAIKELTGIDRPL